MSNEITLSPEVIAAAVAVVDANRPTYAIQIGTKKTPQAFMADRQGVALTNGKAGREARTAEKLSLPEQAVAGNFPAFTGYLVATFPKIVKRFEDRIAGHVLDLEAALADGTITTTQGKTLEQLKTNPLRSRLGVTLLTQLIVSTYGAEGAKTTAAQREALALVADYGAKLQAAIEARKARAQAEQPAPAAE